MGQILKELDDNFFYIEKYLPAKHFRASDETKRDFREKIWDYKNGKEETVTYMTELFIKALKEFVHEVPAKTYIGLIAAPPSKVNKYSPVADSIKRIYKYYKEETKKGNNPFYGHEIKDFSKLLRRITDVPVSHVEKRVTSKEHRDSIACSYSELSKYRATYIIMDDVMTIGTLLYTCEDILLENGADPDSIYKLVLAKTY